jgi:hypothetical protein
MKQIAFEFPDDTDEAVLVGQPAEDTTKKTAVEDDIPDNIEVEDDTPPEDRGRMASEPPDEVTDEELEGYSDKVRKRIKHFTKGYHDERRAKEQALRERQELERFTQMLIEENQRLTSTSNSTTATLVSQARKTLELEATRAKEQYREAYEAGDSEALVKAQEAMFTAKLRQERLEQQEKALQRRNNTVQQPVTTQPANAPDPRAVSWAQQNPWFNSDDEMTSFALGYHAKLVKSGVDPTSDEYYDMLNKRMRQVFPDQFDDEVENEPPRRASASKVAGVTRPGAPKKYKLTATQVQLAKRLGVPLEEYARQVAIEEKRKG